MRAAQPTRDSPPGAPRGGVGPVDKLRWMEMLVVDPRVKNAVRVGVLLQVKYANSITGIAYPSCKTIARDLGLKCAKTAQRAVNDLVKFGYLEKRAGGGRSVSNQYWLRYPCEYAFTDNLHSQTRTFLFEKMGKKCPANPIEEPIDRTRPQTPTVERCEVDLEFDEFERVWDWPAESPRAAKRAFAELGKAEKEEAVRCAPAYLADCRKNERKRCFATTYFRERRWEGFASIASAPATTPALVLVFNDTPQWEAWTKHKGKSSPTPDIKCPDGRYRAGWYFPSEWPPGHPNS